ncbi:MAG: hypothetical protein ABIP95_12730 [Pelobium sp.]
MKKIGIIVGLSLLLLVIAFLIRDAVLCFSIAQITGEIVVFKQAWKLPHQLLPTIIFIFSFGIIPLLTIFVNRICRLTSLRRQITSTTMIIVTGILFYVFRVVFLKIKAAQINDLLRRAEFATEADIPRIRFEDMHLGLYILIGLVVGSLFSILIYRKKSKPAGLKKNQELT